MKRGLTIALLNGWASDDALWSPIVPSLQQYGTVTCVPIMASIKEVALPLETQLTDQQCSALCDSLLAALPENTVLIGWSLGGMLAVRMAARCPEKIIGLITLASNLRFVANDAWPKAMDVETFEQFQLLFQRKPVKALKRFSLLETHGDQYAKTQLLWLQKTNYDRDEYLLAQGLNLLCSIDNIQAIASVQCPVLHCFGERDSLVPLEAARAIQQQYTHHAFAILANRGHVLHYPDTSLLSHLRCFFSKLC